MIKDKSIFIKNIYYMLSYVFDALKNTNYEDIAKEDFDNLHNLFGTILSKGIGQQLKQGLYKEYTVNVEDMTTLRGKINIQGSLKHKFEKKQVLSCEFDEFTENNIYTQIIKTTCFYMISHSNVDNRIKNDIKKYMLFFKNVDQIDLKIVRWSTINFSRNNQTYRLLISLCQLVFEEMMITTESGNYKMINFLSERCMSSLYEKFILKYYIKHYPDLKVSASEIKWALDDGIGTLLPIMQTDTTIIKEDKVLIIDAKYYTKTTNSRYEDNHKLHSGNLYQMFTYVKNSQLVYTDKTVTGMLLYAKTDEDIQPNNEYSMSGNKIIVRTLDLNKDFIEISKQLDLIINNYLFS